MSKVIHAHIGKSRDAREERFGIPVYTEAEIMKKLRDGEWEAQTDVIKGKRVEMRKGSKRFQVYVADAKAKDAVSIKNEAKLALKKAISELLVLSRGLSDADDKSQCNQARRLVEQALGKVENEILEK